MSGIEKKSCLFIRSEWVYASNRWNRVYFSGAMGTWYSFTEQFEFTGNLKSFGFGDCVHRGYVRPKEEILSWTHGYPAETNAYKRVFSDPAILFDPDNGSIFAAGIVGDYEDILDYDNGEILGAPDINVSQVPIRDFLLAKAFPSRTGPMGSSSNSVWHVDVNFDMFNLFRTDPAKWLFEDSDHNKLWRHSDWKDAPYVHVYKLFDKITGKEN